VNNPHRSFYFVDILPTFTTSSLWYFLDLFLESPDARSYLFAASIPLQLKLVCRLPLALKGGDPHLAMVPFSERSHRHSDQ